MSMGVGGRLYTGEVFHWLRREMCDALMREGVLFLDRLLT
jgi:hypothetical protein